MAQSSTRVSSFMRNIDGSEWLRNPELEVVKTTKDKGPGSNFTLYADQVSTVVQDESTGKGKGRPGAKVMASRGAQ
jgi:Tfp pilus assembly protein PilN